MSKLSGHGDRTKIKMYILYTYDYIMAGIDEEQLRNIAADIKAPGLDITEEGDIKYFLGVKIYKVYSKTYYMSHP